jgi:hypothetical protein
VYNPALGIENHPATGKTTVMPRRASPPRLWLRPARRDKSGRVTHQETYVILDRGRQIVVGGDIHEAERALAKHLAQKHSAGIAHRGVRETDQIPVCDVLTLYRHIAPNQVTPQIGSGALSTSSAASPSPT